MPEAVAAITARASAVEGFTGRYGMAVLGISPDAAEALIAETRLARTFRGQLTVVGGGLRRPRRHRDADRPGRRRGNVRPRTGGGFPRTPAGWTPPRKPWPPGLPDLRFAHPAIPFIGAATGAAVPGDTEFADYWPTQPAHREVRFDAAVRTAVDLGAHLRRAVRAPGVADGPQRADRGHTLTVATLCSGRRHRPDGRTRRTDRRGDVARHPWRDYLSGTEPLLPGFPNAPMKTDHHWLAPRAARTPVELTVAVERWNNEPCPNRPPGPGAASPSSAPAPGRRWPGS